MGLEPTKIWLTAQYPNPLALIHFSRRREKKKAGEAPAETFKAAPLDLQFNVKITSGLVKGGLDPCLSVYSLMLTQPLYPSLLSISTYAHQPLTLFNKP